MLCDGDVELDDLEDARLVADVSPPPPSAHRAELAQLPQAPLGLDVARREDDDEYRGLREARDQRLGEHVVALQLAVAPDAHGLARQLFEANLQALVEGLDPALESFGERLVVDVRVAYEEVVFEVGGRGHLRLLR